MEKVRDMDSFRKSVLFVTAAMLLVFTVLYCVRTSRRGFLYRDEIFVPEEEGTGMVYRGTLQGEEAVFTVTEGREVSFRCGEKEYGPYTFREDAGAVPEGEDPDNITGAEILCGEEVLFRGGIYRQPGLGLWLINEDGSAADAGFAVMAQGQDTVTEVNGKATDPLEPSLQEIACLMLGPELTHKGDWSVWLGGAALCLITWITVLFADELFRLQMSFRIRDAEWAEPSEWEMAGRYISWAVLPLLALAAFAAGLLI
jgi:hypothetical protein